MSRTKCSRGWRLGSKVRFGVFVLGATVSLAAQLGPQTGAETAHGALEMTSALGRRLYALPDDERVLDAAKSWQPIRRMSRWCWSFRKRRRHAGSIKRRWQPIPQGWLLLPRVRIFIWSGATANWDCVNSSPP